MLVSIRAFQPGDTPGLMAVFSAAVRQIAARDYDPAQIAAWASSIDTGIEAWTARFVSRPTWVALAGTAPVGFGDIEPDGHIDGLYVHPDYRGRGIAGCLLDKIQSVAIDRGLWRLYTEASITARPVFSRHGFSVLAQQTVCYRGQDFINYRMERIIGQAG